MSMEKQVFNVVKKKLLHKCLHKIPLWRQIHNATFLISSKNLKRKQNFHTITFWNYLLLNMAVWWGRSRARRHWWATIVWKATVDTMWKNSQCLAVVIEGTSQSFLLKRLKRWTKKSITFCFLKLEAKEKASFSKFIQGRVIFLWKD